MGIKNKARKKWGKPDLQRFDNIDGGLEQHQAPGRTLPEGIYTACVTTQLVDDI